MSGKILICPEREVTEIQFRTIAYTNLRVIEKWIRAWTREVKIEIRSLRSNYCSFCFNLGRI